MDDIYNIIKFLPFNIQHVLSNTIEGNTNIINNLQEIRIRSEKPIILKLNKSSIMLEYIVSQNEILQTLEKLCENSIYAYKNQICEGFLTIKGGHRVRNIWKCCG